MLILVISLLVIGGVLLSNFISFSNIEQIIVDQLKDQQEIETDHATILIDNHIRQVQSELIALRQLSSLGTASLGYSLPEGDSAFQNLIRLSSSLLVARVDGTIFESTAEDYRDFVGFNIRNKDYFKVPAENKKPYVSVLSQQGSNTLVVVSAPLFKTTTQSTNPNSEGEFIGVILSFIDFGELSRLYIQPITKHDQRLFLLVDADNGKTIMKSPSLPDYAELRALLPPNDLLPVTVPDFLELGDTIITASDLWLNTERWILLVLAPMSYSNQEFRTFQRRYLFGMVFVFFSLTSVFYLSLSLYRSKEELQSKLDTTKVLLKRSGVIVAAEKLEEDPSKAKSSAELLEEELQILRLINRSNTTNRMTCFKDITKDLAITKPTTRKRISRLTTLGLIFVERRGRLKLLKLTPSGRRLLNPQKN